MFQFSCIGRDGVQRVFKYTLDKDLLSSQWNYRVTTDQPLSSGEFFELNLAELDEATVRVAWISHHNVEEYRMKGIPEEIIQIASKELGRTVQSSPEYGDTNDVRRSSEATKVWKRLVAQGIATHNESTDIYECTRSA
jgi:hypothetical protein